MSFRPTPEQMSIIGAPVEARILVQAGAGSGKTEVVARRIAHLLDSGLKPRELLVLSFSRAAVRVLTERLRKVAKEGAVEELRWTTVRTFDSWAFRLLRQLGNDPATLLAGDFNQTITRASAALRTDGVLSHPQAGLTPIRHLIVDEIQDLTDVRAVLVRTLLELLAPPTRTGTGFTLLGDSHQAIYDWTLGGGPAQFSSGDLLRWLGTTYGKELRALTLSGNQRATTSVAEFLDAVRRSLEVKTSGAKVLLDLQGARNRLPEDDLAAVVRDIGSGRHTIAILCRDNGQVLRIGDALSEELAKSGAPLSITVLGGSPPRVVLPSWIGRLLWRYESSQLSRQHFAKLFRTLDCSTAPCPPNAETAWLMLMRFARTGEEETALSMDALRQRVTWPDSLPDDECERTSPVLLTTVHQSKGREFDTVLVFGTDTAGMTDPMEEARVIYVGLTRARTALRRLGAVTEPLFNTVCWRERKRWHRWAKRKQGAFHHLELGCEGDVDDESIIQGTILGGEASVRKTQELLASCESSFVGLPVIATKEVVSITPRRVAYRLNAELPSHGNVCLGRFSDVVSQDVYSVKVKQQGMPRNIYGLRIGAVKTCVAAGDLPADIPGPWRDSRIWLGVTVHGLATFMTYWQN